HPTSPYSLSFASSSSFFFSCSRHHPAPHSFPTRRSSDLLGAPHLVASRAPGTPFYSSIWEVWTVHVPDGFDVTTIRSAADVKSGGFPVSSSGIRLDCPAVAVDGVPIPPEDAFAMLLNDNGRFNPDKPFQFDVPETPFTKPR